MSADIAQRLHTREQVATRSRRARIVRGLGPLTAVVGIVWAVAQPWRLTLLHPHGQGLWWLIVEPPLYVVLVGVLFRFVVAPGLVEDMEAEE